MPTKAEEVEYYWLAARKGKTTFRDLARRFKSHKNVQNETPRWTEYYFPDGSSIRSYGTGSHHRYEIFLTRRQARA